MWWNIENANSSLELPFRDPEALAVALENRLKNNLAFRVREISWQVTDSTTDKWSFLRSELWYVEERQIREALPETAILFDEWMTETERSEARRVNQVVSWAAVWWALVEWSMWKIDKWLSFLEKVSNWWDNFNEALDAWWEKIESWKFREAFTIFGLWFWGNYNKEKLENERKLAQNSDNMKSIWETDVVKDVEYDLSLKWLIWLSKDKKEEFNAFIILKNPQIRASNFSKLKSLKQDWISEALKVNNLSDKKQFEGQAFNAIQLIVKKESLIQNLIWKEKPNWREELTLEEILTRAYKYTVPYTSFENFSLNDLHDWKINFWTFDLSNPKSDLKWKFDKLRSDEKWKLNWVDEWLIRSLLLDSTSKITNPNQLQMLQSLFKSEKDKKFAEEFVNFWTKFLEKIKTDFFLWDEKYKTEFAEYFNTRSLSSREVFELYLITWWKIDFSEINSFEKWLIYFKVWQYLWSRNWNVILRWNTYDEVMIDEVIKFTSNSPSAIYKLPEPVLSTFASMLEYTKNTAINKTMKVTSEIFSALTLDKIIIIWWVTLATLYVLLKTWPIRNKALWLAYWVAISSLVLLVATVRRDNPEKISKEYSNMTNEEIAELMQKEIKSNSI